MDLKKIIWIVVGIIVIIGALVGLTFMSNVTGNVITSSSVNTLQIEQDSFKINDDVNLVEVNDGSHDSG
ncbi:MAG: hypothetical protein KKF50_00915 [Nanoarchaeota archaeon]|nr:hypothetical protein [Nanoarchaeota archaeon]